MQIQNAHPEGGLAMKLLRLLPLLFTRFRKEMRMVWGVLTHRDSPLSAKLAVMFAFAYLVSPVDLIPDVLPVLGLMDDAGVLVLFLNIAYKLLPRELYASLREKVYGDKAPATANTGTRREPQIIDVTPKK
jgi:uncharacterized membrane protein YkvA (DUF1232 family)